MERNGIEGGQGPLGKRPEPPKISQEIDRIMH